MTIRELQPDDLQHLPASGFKAFGPFIECALVVVDEENRPIMACSAERVAELHMICGEGSAGVKLAAIKALHQEMSVLLRAKSYNSGQAFVQNIRFGKRLERWFGWARTLPCWTVRF